MSNYRRPAPVKTYRTDLVAEFRAAESERLGRQVSQREVVDSALLHCREHGLVRLHPETAPTNKCAFSVTAKTMPMTSRAFSMVSLVDRLATPPPAPRPRDRTEGGAPDEIAELSPRGSLFAPALRSEAAQEDQP